MRSVSNLLNTTSISCPLKPIFVWIWWIFSISRETIEKPLDKFLYYEVLTKFTGRLTQLKICMTNNKNNVWIEQNSRKYRLCDRQSGLRVFLKLNNSNSQYLWVWNEFSIQWSHTPGYPVQFWRKLMKNWFFLSYVSSLNSHSEIGPSDWNQSLTLMENWSECTPLVS